MRYVFVAGIAAGVVCLVVNRAFAMLNEANDVAVAAGYLILVALVSAVAGAGAWWWRRL